MGYMDDFDAVKVKDEIVQWLRDTFEENGKDCNAVIGISGGKDSSVVAALCAEALGPDRVIGVMMPDGWQKDSEDARAIIEHLKIRWTYLNIGQACAAILDNMDKVYAHEASPVHDTKLIPSMQTKTNLPARIRMATLYAVAQSNNGRVMNTCNLSEDWVGYSTRYGDSAGDFAPLAELTTDEVIAVGAACGVPNDLLYKAPSDGLCGKTDEENLGFTYAVLNKYIRTGECADTALKARIDEMHERNFFKLMPMPTFLPHRPMFGCLGFLTEKKYEKDSS